MLRDTMMSTMPVAMTAIAELWTDRFHRFRGVKNRPPDATLKPIQMMASAAIMPSMRVSISIENSSERRERGGFSVVGGVTIVAWVILTPLSPATVYAPARRSHGMRPARRILSANAGRITCSELAMSG
jgi:hypothetical protein